MECPCFTKKKDCIVFENVECCERDSLDLIKQVIQFSRNSGYSAVSIMEWNGNEAPEGIDLDCSYIPFSKLDNSVVAQYIQDHICAESIDNAAYVINQLVKTCEGNLLNLRLSINILVQRGILLDESGGMYSYTGRTFKSSLLLQYLELFRELNEQIQCALKMVSPFEDEIYVSLLGDVFSNCQALDAYLDELSDYQSFVQRLYTPSTPGIFSPKYMFTSGQAREAVVGAVLDGSDPELSLQRITARLYQHLETLHGNKMFYNALDDMNRIRLLRLLTKVRNSRLTVNHLPYYVELMEYYFQQSSYWALIQSAERFLKAHALSTVQIHKLQPSFFRLLFKAQLATGQYHAITCYEDSFQEWDIRLLIARAYYNSGNPQKALGICREIHSLKGEPSHGEVFSLEASIYDWLGNSRQSLTAFKKALQCINGNQELKYTLFKKYSLYVDF